MELARIVRWRLSLRPGLLGRSMASSRGLVSVWVPFTVACVSVLIAILFLCVSCFCELFLGLGVLDMFMGLEFVDVAGLMMELVLKRCLWIWRGCDSSHKKSASLKTTRHNFRFPIFLQEAQCHRNLSTTNTQQMWKMSRSTRSMILKNDVCSTLL